MTVFRWRLLAVIFVLGFSLGTFQTSSASNSYYDSAFKITDVDVEGFFGTTVGSATIKVGEISATGRAKANLLFLHGFADTFDNHTALLKSASQNGYNVIAFDYPEHGQSSGSIRAWGLLDIAQIIPTLIKDRRLNLDPKLPLVIAGWSTGATIAIRIAQSWSSSVLPGNFQLQGVLAITPALPARIVLSVDEKKLTRGQMKHSPKPTRVPVAGQFAGSITTVSRTARLSNIPRPIESLFLIAGDKDSFANSGGAISFVRNSAANVQGFTCPQGFHGLEFEPDGIGTKVQSLAIDFLKNLAGNNKKLSGNKNCKKIEKN